jgi:epoxyqueuosine reductase
MGWMGTERNRQRRANPKVILPECQSILVLGIAYSPSNPIPTLKGQGRVASYALGDDYHDVLPERLKSLVAFIEAKIGYSIPNRWYTDTGPILERELAQRAGLGWIGKNTCLINPHAGSYFLLAEILLGLDLPPDEPITSDHCGTCTRCIEACPTDCILPSRTIDANQCISYLTIEEKDAVPEDMRSQMGNWIFGCDICQQVCPWNQRFAVPSAEMRFIPASGSAHPTLKDELVLTPLAFNQKFKGSPIKRAKRRGYLRNVAVALGNLGEPDTIAVLSQALNDPEPQIRSHAAWALGQIGDKSVHQVLDQALANEQDETVQAEIKTARAKINP